MFKTNSQYLKYDPIHFVKSPSNMIVWDYYLFNQHLSGQSDFPIGNSFRFVYLFGRQSKRERESKREEDLPSVGSLIRLLHQPGLHSAESRNSTLISQMSGRSPST